MAAAASLSALLALSLFAIFVFPAALGDAGSPVEPREQPTSLALPLLQHGNGDVAENHPNSYDRALPLRLPSEKNLPIFAGNPRMQPDDAYAEWQRRFPVHWRPFDMPFHGEFGRSRLDERDLIFRRFPFGCRWPFRFGRHGGCDHARCRHFLMRRGCYSHRYFPGRTGRDLNAGFGRPGNPGHVAVL